MPVSFILKKSLSSPAQLNFPYIQIISVNAVLQTESKHENT